MRAQDGCSRSLETKNCCLQFNGLEWRHTPAAYVDAADLDSEQEMDPTLGDVDIDDTSRL